MNEKENLVGPGLIILFDGVEGTPDRKHGIVRELTGVPSGANSSTDFVPGRVRLSGVELAGITDKTTEGFDLAECASDFVGKIIKQNEQAAVGDSDGTPSEGALEWIARTAIKQFDGFNGLDRASNKDLSGKKGNPVEIGRKLINEAGFPDLIVQDSEFGNSVPENYLVEAKNPNDVLRSYQRGWMYKYRDFPTYVATVRPVNVDLLNERPSNVPY